MKLEHIAINVAEIQPLVAWYVKHLGFSIIRREQVPPFKTFLGKDARGVMLELYSNPEAPFQDYARQHPTVFHLGFEVADARAARSRLEKVSATYVSEITTRSGNLLIMLRDPWGIPIQLCERS